MYQFKPEIFNQISAATCQIFFDCNATTGEIHWIGPTEQVFGISAENLPTQHDRWLDGVHDDDRVGLLHQRLTARDAVAPNVNAPGAGQQNVENQNVAAAEKPATSAYQVDYRYQRTDGSWAGLNERGLAVMDPGDQSVHWVGAVENISTHRQIEKDLLQFRFALDHSSDAVFITDLNGNIQYINPAFEKIYGYTWQEAIGQNPRLIKSGLIEREQYEQFWQSLLHKQVVSAEIVNKAKDGRLVPVDSTNTPILDENDEIVGYMAAQRDISKLKQAEEQMEERLREINTLYRAASQEGWEMVLSDNTLTPAYRFSHEAVAPAEDLWSGTTSQEASEPNLLAALIEQAVVAKTLVQGDAQQPFAVAPLADRGGNVIGALGVQDDPQHPLSEDELTLIEQISEQVALALESSRLFTQTQAALAETRALYNVASRLSSAQSFQEIVAVAAQESHIADMNRAVLIVLSYDHEGKVMDASVKGNWFDGNGTPPTPVGTQYRAELFGQMVRQFSPDEATFVGDTGEGMRQRGIGCVVAMPLWVGGQQAGWLMLQGEQPHVFSEAEKRPVNTLAQQVAIAMQSRLLFEQMERGREQLSEALRIANMGYIEIDFANEMITLSDEYYRLLRTTAENEGGYVMPLAQYSAKYMQPEDSQALLGSIQTATETNASQDEVEFQTTCADGERRWLSVQFSYTYDEQGKPTLALGAAQDITERKQTREALARRARELTTVADLGTQISAVLDPTQLLQSVVDLVKENFNLYHAHIYLLNDHSGMLGLSAGAGEVGRKMMLQGWQIPIEREKSLVARVARSRQGVIVNNVYADEGYLANELLPDTRSELAVPLMVGDRVLGVLDIQSDVVDRFTAEDIAIQTVLASQVAVALQNARTYAQTQRQAEYEALINTISQKIQSTTSVENALQVAVRELGRALGASRTSVQLGLGKRGLKS